MKELQVLINKIQKKGITKNKYNAFGKFGYYQLDQAKSLVNDIFAGSDYMFQFRYGWLNNDITGEYQQTLAGYVIDMKTGKDVLTSGDVLFNSITQAGMTTAQVSGSNSTYIGKYIIANMFSLPVDMDSLDPDVGKKTTVKKAKVGGNPWDL